ncbi:MAG: hypothetical protein E6R03_05435 [Hyphomicrobiaceae bacterium]|nr:MAG: hypothetical protein E6R03_05435 [Hyphomicrobiaceae bacterium]
MGWREYLDTLSRDELHETLENMIIQLIDGDLIGYREGPDCLLGELYWVVDGAPIIEREQ